MRFINGIIAIAKSRLFRWTVAIVTIVIVAHHVYVYIATARIKHEIANTYNLPTEYDEIAPPPKTVNDPTEGLVTIDQIADAMVVEAADYDNPDLPYFGKDDECCVGQPLDDAQRAAIRQFLEKNAAALALAKQFTENGWYGPPVPEEPVNDYFEDVLVFSLGHNRQSARLLTLATIHHADRGDFAEALQRIEQMFATAKTNNPFVIGYLSSSAAESYARVAAEWILTHGDLSHDELIDLWTVFYNADTGGDIGYTAATEAAFGSGYESDEDDYSLEEPTFVFEGPILGPVADGVREVWKFTKESFLFISGIEAHAELAIWRMALLCIEKASEPIHIQYERNVAFREHLEGVSIQGWALRVNSPMYMVSIFESIPDVEARRAAERRAVIISTAIERYRLDHGTVPSTLDQLMPDYLETIPLDPYNGEPMRYATFDGGYGVYSVERDLVDDSAETLADPDWHWQNLGVVIRR